MLIPHLPPATYGVSFGPLGAGYRATRIFDSGWIEYFCGQGLYWVLFLILVESISGSSIIP
jgi:hypothetical protein